ncbi:MAG: MoxR family ATPase [Spirochaetes bacterium]|nr:MoxR family ATPase [Spirochaetota bacterium]
MAIKECKEKIEREIEKAVIGQTEAIEQIILAFFANGHVLLEGVPGLAKTLIAKSFARALGLNFSRIQCTPDLMPSDIIGTNVFDLQKSQFTFHEGPVFTNILLVDEINRASPKTQSALLEVMQEKQVTIDGKRYAIPHPFMVIATQNPIEFEGTYPLPEAQTDRFLMKVIIDYPSKNIEIEILKKFSIGFTSENFENIPIKSIGISKLDEYRKELNHIRVDDIILNYIHELTVASRTHPAILLGASTRAAIGLLNASKVRAALQGRKYVIPDDVKWCAFPVLRHRVILHANAEIEGKKPDEIVREIINRVEAPR